MLLENRYQPGNPAFAGTASLVVLSGCSGGGKSTLLSDMARRGYPVKTEAGRQIVREQMQIGGDGLPWANTETFIHLAISRAMQQFNTAEPTERPVLFDRGLVDLLPFFEQQGGVLPADMAKAAAIYRYAATVFFVPPWEDIFETEPERQKGFAEAVEGYQALESVYRKLGYELIEVPRLPVKERADWLETRLTM